MSSLDIEKKEKSSAHRVLWLTLLISGPSSRRKTPPEENESAKIKETTADASASKSKTNGASKYVKTTKSSLDDMFGTESVRYCGFCAKIFVGQEALSKHLAESHPGFYQL